MTSFIMTKDEAADLARFIERIRRRLPGDTWHKPGIEDALGRARDRAPAPDLAIAAIRAAENPLNRTPAIIGMDGPHWREATTPPRPEQVDRGDRCSICSLHRNACQLRWAHDHQFESAAEAAERKGANPEATSAAIAALKAEVAATPPRDTAPRRGLEDLPERNPKLRAKVDTLRGNVAGLRSPQLREAEPPPPEPEPTRCQVGDCTRGHAHTGPHQGPPQPTPDPEEQPA